MAATFPLVVFAIVASSADADRPTGNAGQRLAGAAAAVAGPNSADEDKVGILPDQVMDPAFSFEASRQVLAKIKAEAPARRERWLKGTVELKSAAAKSRVAAADYENKMTKLDATVAMADKGVVHLRQDISNEHVRNAAKIREHLKSMKKDVSTQLARAAVAGAPVEHSQYEGVDGQTAMQVGSESHARVQEGTMTEAQVEADMGSVIARQRQETEHEEAGGKKTTDAELPEAQVEADMGSTIAKQRQETEHEEAGGKKDGAQAEDEQSTGEGVDAAKMATKIEEQRHEAAEEEQSTGEAVPAQVKETS